MNRNVILMAGVAALAMQLYIVFGTINQGQSDQLHDSTLLLRGQYKLLYQELSGLIDTFPDHNEGLPYLCLIARPKPDHKRFYSAGLRSYYWPSAPEGHFESILEGPRNIGSVQVIVEFAEFTDREFILQFFYNGRSTYWEFYTATGNTTSGRIYASPYYGPPKPQPFHGIYQFVDDILIIAIETSRFEATQNEDDEFLPPGIEISRFQSTPQTKDFIEFFVLQRLEPSKPKPSILTQERLAHPQLESRLRGRWIVAPKEPYYGSKDRLLRLLYSLDAIQVKSNDKFALQMLDEESRKRIWLAKEQVFTPIGPLFDEDGRMAEEEAKEEMQRETWQKTLQLARERLGDVYPIANWSFRDGIIYQRTTWTGIPTLTYRYKATQLTKNGGEIDLYPPQEPAVQPLKGIYYILDDFLIICYNDWRISGLPKHERPSFFRSNKEVPYTIEILRRAPKEHSPEQDEVYDPESEPAP